MTALLQGSAGWTSAIAATSAVASPASSAVVADAPVDPVDAQQAAAVAQAAATGAPVTIDALTDENSQVKANPDGTFTLDSYREAVRVDQNGQWVPVDPTLQANPDGSLSPNASTQDVRFSGGGTGPAVTVSKDGASVSTSMPMPLPAPVVDGDTATYRNVLPGTDLTLTAQPEGYTSVLVVHDATAAANPALANLKLHLAATGVDLTQQPDGSMTATDTNGTTVFSSSVPTMWDSTADATQRAAGDVPAADDPASGVVHVVDTSDIDINAADSTTAVKADLVLTPPAAALTGPTVVYPLYIDPPMTGGRTMFRVVRSTNYANYTTNDDNLRAGYCDWGSECAGGPHIARSYFYLSTAAMLAHPNPKVIQANVYVTQVHNGGCTGTPVSLWSAHYFDPATTNWPGPTAALLQTSGDVDFGGNSVCPKASADIAFGNNSVTSQIQDIVDANHDVASFGLVSPREGDRNAWKRFGNNPRLSATFAWPDPVPAGRDYSRISCTAVTYVNDATPTFYAETSDYNDNAPTLEFDVYNGAGQHWGKSVASGGNGQQAAWTAPTLPSGVTYAWRVRGVTSYGSTVLNSDWSSAVSFIVDTSPPSAPVTASYDYPPNLWGAAAGKTITSTIATAPYSDPGQPAPAPAGYAFGWDVTPPNLSSSTCAYTAAANARTGFDVDGTVTVPTDLPPGKHTLNTVAFDGAHNVSASTAYSFYVSPTITGAADTRLEGEDILDPTTPATTADWYKETVPTASGGKRLRILPKTPNPIGQQVTTTFTVGIEADYGLSALMTAGSHYGQVKFLLDNQPVVLNDSLLIYNGYTTDWTLEGPQWTDLGGAHLKPGKHTLAIVLTGHTATSYTDPNTRTDDQGYAVGLDLLTVAPVNNITTASFLDALNNHGIVNTDRATDTINASTNLAFSGGRSNLPLAALQSVGINRTTSVAIDGVPFTLPAPKGAAGGYADNVVAMGQTIPIGPTPQKLKSVDLLVAAACGDAAPAFTTGSVNYVQAKFTINHQESAGPPDEGPPRPTPNVPTVPDFYKPTSTDSTFTYPVPTTSTSWPTSAFLVSGWKLPYVDLGTTPGPDVGSTTTPWVYHLKIRIASYFSTNPVVSLTLPNIGTTFIAGSCRPSLHVLAMTAVPAA